MDVFPVIKIIIGVFVVGVVFGIVVFGSDVAFDVTVVVGVVIHSSVGIKTSLHRFLMGTL